MPETVGRAAAQVDAAVLATVSVCFGGAVAQDPLYLQRLKLPARMFGVGVRSLADVAPAAFLGALSRTVPTFLDRVATHILAFEGDSEVRWFEGGWTLYEADRRRRLGDAAVNPTRLKYRKLTRG